MAYRISAFLSVIHTSLFPVIGAYADYVATSDRNSQAVYVLCPLPPVSSKPFLCTAAFTFLGGRDM